MPYFSVCIPNFNYGHYLAETIQCVLNQTFADFEVIVVDNASTDNSVAVVESFTDSRIRLYRNRYNIGFAPNLQRASQYATGEFMILVSSDDLMYPTALEEYAKILKRQGERAHRTVLCASTDTIDSDGTILAVNHLPEGRLIPVTTPVERLGNLSFEGESKVSGRTALSEALRQCCSLASFVATAYPRAMWEEVEGYDTMYQIMPDAAFLHKLLALDPDFICVRKRLFAYRVHGTNQTAKATKQRALRNQSDGYMRSLSFPSKTLDDIGVTRLELIDAFLRVLCFDQSLSALSRFEWLNGLRLLLFGLACYPGRAVRSGKFYILLILIALGPLACVVCHWARRIRDGR